MKDFEARWQTCVAAARTAAPRNDGAPTGFAGRVVARAFPDTRICLEAIWERLALRLLGGAAAVLLVCAALEAPHLREAPLRSGVENSMTQIIWSL